MSPDQFNTITTLRKDYKKSNLSITQSCTSTTGLQHMLNLSTTLQIFISQSEDDFKRSHI